MGLLKIKPLVVPQMGGPNFENKRRKKLGRRMARNRLKKYLI